MAVIWGLINPDMFIPMADTIEDIMQASAPGVVENVRIAEIDQGSNPLRILSMRALPDDHVQNLKDNIHEENLKNKDPQEAAAAEEGGSFYNMEASFAYHAQPTGQSTSSKARNMHMNLVFYLGIRGLFGVPFPVFVELTELVGTVRLRFQLMPEPPFMKEVTFSLVGIPHVRAGCMPMLRRGVNVLNLPLISKFVNYAISTACAMFAAPKSMTLDLSMMLKGDDIQKETQALGVMWIRIHRALGLSKQDRRGSEGGGSDPYINLSFSKYGKPMYCTRVITDDLNPIWEETAALLVTPELIKANENLSVELWDSDRHTADDVCGKVELPIREMLQHPGRMYPQVSKLQGLNEGSEMPGELHWEVGYFGKPKLRPELRTDGRKKDLPENLQGDPVFEDDKGTITNEEEDAVAHTPPDPLWPSGIVSIVVHQIVNLELNNIKGSSGNRKGKEFEPAKPYGENTEEEGKNLPTSYCKIQLNDQLVWLFLIFYTYKNFNIGGIRSIQANIWSVHRFTKPGLKLLAQGLFSMLVRSDLFVTGDLPWSQLLCEINVTENTTRFWVLSPSNFPISSRLALRSRVGTHSMVALALAAFVFRFFFGMLKQSFRQTCLVGTWVLSNSPARRLLPRTGATMAKYDCAPVEARAN